MCSPAKAGKFGGGDPCYQPSPPPQLPGGCSCSGRGWCCSVRGLTEGETASMTHSRASSPPCSPSPAPKCRRPTFPLSPRGQGLCSRQSQTEASPQPKVQSLFWPTTDNCKTQRRNCSFAAPGAGSWGVGGWRRGGATGSRCPGHSPKVWMGLRKGRSPKLYWKTPLAWKRGRASPMSFCSRSCPARMREPSGFGT